MNRQNEFGIINTTTKPVIFNTATKSDGTTFDNIAFLQDFEEDSIIDLCTSDFINGETCCIMKNKDIVIFDKETISMNAKHDAKEVLDYSSVVFHNNPRVCLAGFQNSIDVIDFRKKDQFCITINAHLPSSILPLDSPFRFATTTTSGLCIYDTRFPSRCEDLFVYQFESPASTMRLEKFCDFNVVVVGCFETSDVICFPFNNTNYAEPIIPFDTKLTRYDFMEPYSLTGMELTESNVFIQYENSCVLRFDLSPDETSRSFFIPIAERCDTQTPKDVFKFNPTFDNSHSTQYTRSRSNDVNIAQPKWKVLFPEMEEIPPTNTLYNNEVKNIPDDEEMQGYLTDIEDALTFNDEYMDEILPAIFKHHMDLARQVTKK